MLFLSSYLAFKAEFIIVYYVIQVYFHRYINKVHNTMIILDVTKLHGMTQQDSRRQLFSFLEECMFCVFGWKGGVYH